MKLPRRRHRAITTARPAKNLPIRLTQPAEPLFVLGVFNVPFKLLLKSRKIMTRLVNLTIWIWQG